MNDFVYYKKQVGKKCFVINKITSEQYPTRMNEPYEIIRTNDGCIDLHKKRKGQTGWEERVHLTPEMCEIYKLQFVK